MNSDNQYKSVPKSALQFRFGTCEFGDNGPDAKTVPFSMVARTGDPITHWYWDRVVHDMNGMQIHKSRLPIDYVHDETEILGYANHFDTSSGDLIANGVIQSYKEGDRAGEVIFRGRNGQPYEASITHDDDIVIEELPEGAMTEVNGRQVQGPLTIIRQWALRGIAVCPYGADRNTSTDLSDQNKTIQVKVLRTMSQNTEAEAVAEAPAVEPQAEPDVQPVAEQPEVPASFSAGQTPDPKQDGQRFLDTFGEKGGVWFAQGKSYDEALHLFVGDLKQENQELKTRLAALAGYGAKTPVTFQPEQPADGNFDSKKFETLSKRVSTGVAAHAATMKLPRK